MHSKRHRRERRWIELRIILAAAAQRQAQKITLTNQPKK